MIYKLITEANKKLKEVYIHLWGLHISFLLSEKIYMVILLGAKTCKIWGIYLCSKDEFIDAF